MIERCVFNAGFGAIGDDFRSLQYFSNVNQFIATSDSDHNPQNYGTTWMQYRARRDLIVKKLLKDVLIAVLKYCKIIPKS